MIATATGTLASHLGPIAVLSLAGAQVRLPVRNWVFERQGSAQGPKTPLGASPPHSEHPE